MLNTKTLFSLLLVGSTSLSFAEGISDEDIKKALEGITPTRVMKASEPKIVSEVIVTEASKQSKKEEKVTTKKVNNKKNTKKVYKKKKIYKVKKIHKKKKVEVDMSQLQEVQTLGVVSTSEPFELKN
jgi:hypothetical protein